MKILCMYQLMYYQYISVWMQVPTWYLVPPGKVFAKGGICRSHVIIFVFYRPLHAGVIVTAKAKASIAQLYVVVT